MKAASIATIAIIDGGQALRADLYTFTLAGGSPTYYFTTAQQPMTVGGQTYQTGLLIKRGKMTQKVGLEVDSMELTITPQSQNVIIGGYPFLKAVANRVLEGAHVTMSKLFLSSWSDTSPGAIPWRYGRVDGSDVTRFDAVLQVVDGTQILDVQMPPNVLQPMCMHTLFDTGCTLNPANFRIAGTVASGSTVTGINTTLTQPTDYFTLGGITFTSGANQGVTRLVKHYLNASGAMTFAQPLPNAPSSGDTFTALPGCAHNRAACGNTNPAVGPAFNNLPHLKETPFVPVPETMYDGGTMVQGSTTLGSQGGARAGSSFASAATRPGSYRP